MVRTTSRMSPSVSRKRFAARSTSACGGVSATNRRASLVAMNRAVDGCAGQDVEHLLAVLLAAARLDRVAEHHLLAVVVHARLEPEAAAEARVLRSSSR